MFWKTDMLNKHIAFLTANQLEEDAEPTKRKQKHA